MSLARSLHKTGLICFFQQFLRVRHEPSVLQQATSLRHLSSQCLASFLPCPLQSLGERSVTLGESGRQIPDALSQLLSGRHAVYLVRKKHKDKFGELTPGFCWYILKKGPNNIIKHFEKKHIFGVIYETCSSCT